MVMNYTEVEAKVREATNDEAWGPTGEVMAGSGGFVAPFISPFIYLNIHRRNCYVYYMHSFLIQCFLDYSVNT